MDERGITEQQIVRAIDHPDRLQTSVRSEKRFVAKKLISFNGKQHLLLIIYEINAQETTILTVIDTSKIEKYY